MWQPPHVTDTAPDHGDNEWCISLEDDDDDDDDDSGTAGGAGAGSGSTAAAATTGEKAPAAGLRFAHQAAPNSSGDAGAEGVVAVEETETEEDLLAELTALQM